jgi:hypothetical protein
MSNELFFLLPARAKEKANDSPAVREIKGW